MNCRIILLSHAPDLELEFSMPLRARLSEWHLKQAVKLGYASLRPN